MIDLNNFLLCKVDEPKIENRHKLLLPAILAYCVQQVRWKANKYRVEFIRRKRPPVETIHHILL